MDPTIGHKIAVYNVFLVLKSSHLKLLDGELRPDPAGQQAGNEKRYNNDRNLAGISVARNKGPEE